uniref:Uncharacterized protein n=1 Tax=Skeletonema marinoi TaxID=267567 RepID=A0A7S2P872_9STRA|mmetsp:Transcript_15789/g.26652  ORF Transcript_15789/g.26652 Transcript_15789/m.26652 type:complete len:373 (+) Transcript_15789:38-1156(+)
MNSVTDQRQRGSLGWPQFHSNSTLTQLTLTLKIGFVLAFFYSIAASISFHNKASRNLNGHLNNLQLSHLPPSPPAPVLCANGKKKNAVLILFGVPKQFNFVWKAYVHNIIARNPWVKFEVYMHMYSDLHQKPFSNSRNNERNATLDSPDDIRELLDKDEGGTQVMTMTSSQSMFEESDLSWLQQSDLPFFGDYPFETLKNIFRQGNSLKEAFFYGQKHHNNSNDDVVYIFARSDTFLMNPVDIPCSFNLGNTDIIIPRWQSWEGYNDRFAIAGPDAAKVYATKNEGNKQAIVARRSKNKRKPVMNAERMLRDWLLENKLNVTEHEDERAWALLRLRADRSIAPGDLGAFKFKLVDSNMDKNLLQIEGYEDRL